MNHYCQPRIIENEYETNDILVADIIATEPPFGADPSGKEDSTEAIRRALLTVYENGGGTVYLPAGHYRVTGQIRVPAFCTLAGDWQDPETGNEYGTVIFDYEASSENLDTGLFLLGGSAGVKGLTVYYPEQDVNNVKPYPFTFYTTGQGEDYMLASVERCTVLNGYRGIGACVAERNAHEQFTVDTFRGTFLSCGAEVYNQADVGTWENLILSPKYWAQAPEEFHPVPEEKILAVTANGGIGLMLGDLEWTEFANVRVSGFETGVRIVKGKRIEFAGSLVDFTVTGCRIGLCVESIDDRWGMIVANSRISGTECGIENRAKGCVKLCDTHVSGGCLGESEIIVTAEGAASYTIPYTRTYQKPMPRLFIPKICDRTGKEDVSAPLQEALDKAEAAGGGVVYLAAGLYLLNRPIHVSAYVQLRGSSALPNRDQNGNSGGTVLLAGYGCGCRPEKEALITLAGDCAGICGLRIFYYQNNPGFADHTAATAVRGRGNDIYCVNCAIAGASCGVDFTECDRHYIKKLVTCCYDNAILAGGCDGFIDGCLQNGTVMLRRGKLPLRDWIGEDRVFEVLFSYTRFHCDYLILDGAEGETVYNTFAYGVRSLAVLRKSDAFLCNMGADNIGEQQIRLENACGAAVNIMRYNGTSYLSDGKSRFEFYNRLTIGDKHEETLR